MTSTTTTTIITSCNKMIAAVNRNLSRSVDPLKSQLLAQCPRSSSGRASLYDESLFKNGTTLRDFSEIGVSNRADAYLVRRLGKSTTSVCSATMIAVNPRAPCRGINIYTLDKNNRTTYRVYHYWQIKVSDESIDVGGDLVPLSIGEPPSYSSSMATSEPSATTSTTAAAAMAVVVDDSGNGDNDDVNDDIYQDTPETGVPIVTVTLEYNPELTNFESAIMLKYYAMNYRGVTITRRLYHATFNYFKDARRWFDVNTQEIIVQNKNHELLLNDQIINPPSLAYYYNS